MTVIKINAITVPEEHGDEVAKRFAARADAVDGASGFEGFELLRPDDDRNQWLVITRWVDEASFEAWRNSDQAAHAHQSPHEGQPPKHLGLSAELWHYTIEVSSQGNKG
ncbi:MAG: antibiotic biosynthesis monooxygenase [Acidimicrobiales bacterium]|jgi:heme oxygenase (mycobilin-producing)|nr:antibiotic biosynthesis monooxygenase [Acidimicrobiales bacterium]MDG1846828.1 antibiotic biosynthesis monooxygenase [Acidimicrobiales bacterium]